MAKGCSAGSVNTSQKRQKKCPLKSVHVDISTGRLVAKAKARPKLVVQLSSNYVPVNERICVDIDPKPFNHGYFAVSNA